MTHAPRNHAVTPRLDDDSDTGRWLKTRATRLHERDDVELEIDEKVGCQGQGALDAQCVRARAERCGSSGVGMAAATSPQITRCVGRVLRPRPETRVVIGGGHRKTRNAFRGNSQRVSGSGDTPTDESVGRVRDPGVEDTEDRTDAIPKHFDLDTSILLAGFAFEAYASPQGGVRDKDLDGNSTNFFDDFARSVFAGVVEVTIKNAKHLPKGDMLGSSDPYVVVSVGAGEINQVGGSNPGKGETLVPVSAAKTSTKNNTLHPTWNETLKLFIRRTGTINSTGVGNSTGSTGGGLGSTLQTQSLTLTVFDEDWGSSDDLLGRAVVSLNTLIEKASPSVLAAAKIGFAWSEDFALELDTSNATVDTKPDTDKKPPTLNVSIKFIPFNPPVSKFASRGLRNAARLLKEADANVEFVSSSGSDKTQQGASFAAKLAGAVATAAASSLDHFESEKGKKTSLENAWGMDDTNDWSVLAGERALTVRGSKKNTPAKYQKACFVENETTHTQCSVWRSPGDKTIVVAFRGTEMDSPLDFFTDVNFQLVKVDSAAGDGGDTTASSDDTSSRDDTSGDTSGADKDVRVHGGFKAAYDSVRARVFAAVDDCVSVSDSASGGDDTGGTDDDKKNGWHVFVTGHSLGGALATLFALDFVKSVKSGNRHRGVTTTMVNFGSPRVGNRGFCEEYDELVTDSIRIVNRGDLVPTLPALLGYRHVSHGVRIANGGGERALIGLAKRNDVKNVTNNSTDASSDDASDAGKIVALAERLGVVGVLGVDQETASDAVEALASLVSIDALADHFEDEYLVALREVKGF